MLRFCQGPGQEGERLVAVVAVGLRQDAHRSADVGACSLLHPKRCAVGARLQDELREGPCHAAVSSGDYPTSAAR